MTESRIMVAWRVLAVAAVARCLVPWSRFPAAGRVSSQRRLPVVSMLELPSFPTFDLDTLFKADPATMSRERGWLKNAREVSGYAERVEAIERPAAYAMR